MTLGASSPVAFAEARPPSDRVRKSETRQGAPDLGALEALIADPASVSSEEATPAGFIVETPIQDEADADGIGTGEARLEDALAESVSEFAESPTHALQESADPERIADDSPAVHLPVTHETPDVPIEHGTRHAEPTDLGDAAGAAAGDGDPARDKADAGSSHAAPSAGDIVERDTSVSDTSVADTSAVDTGAEDTGVPNKGIEATPGADWPQTVADPSGNEQGDRSDGAGTDGSDGSAAAKTANAAATLDDTLLRDIAEAPTVSSDSIVSGETDAAGLAVDAPLFQDPHPEAGGDAPRSRSHEPLLGAASRSPDATEAVDTAEGAFAQLHAPDDGAGQSMGKARLDESPSAGQGETSTNTEVATAAAVAQGAGSDSDANDSTLLGPDEAGVRPASPVDEKPETGDEASGDRSDGGIEAKADAAAALLDSTLLRQIADSPAVSSDSGSSDRTDAADLAATSTDRDTRQAAGVDSLTDREFDPPLTVDSRHVGVPVAADARAKTLERLESPKPEVGQFVDDLDQTESLAPAGMAADTDGVATGDDAEPVYRLRDLGGSPPSGTDAGHGESAMRRVADAVAASAAEPAISAETDFQEIDAAPSGDAGLLEQSDAAGGNAARSEGAGEIALPETDGTRQETAEAAHERLDRRGDTPAEAPSPARPTVPEAESPLDPADADEPVNVTATEDPGQGDMESEDGSVTVIHLPDLSGPLPSRTDAGHDEALLRQIADVVAASAGEATDSAGANLPGRSAAPAHGSASVPEQGDPGAGDVPRSEDADAIVPTEPESSERCSAPIVPERLDSPGDSRGEAPPFPDSDEPTPESPGGDTGPVAATIARTPEGAGDSTAAPAASESADPFDRTSLDKTAAAAPTEYLDHLESEPDDGAVSVIHLPDLSRTEPPGTAGSHDGSPPRQTADAEAASAGEPAGPPEAASPESEDERPHGIAAASQVEDAPSRDDASPEYASAEVLTESVEAQAPAVPTQVERDEEHGGLAPAGAIGPDASAAAPGIEFDDTLVLELVPGRFPVPGRPPVPLRGRRWRRLLERERLPRVLLGATLSALGMGLAGLGMAGLLAAPADAQTIDPDIFAAEDSATRDLLGFLGDVDVARHAVLGDMLFVFNGGVLVLAGFLLLWHSVAGAVDTARTGRWGFGAWEIVRIVVAVALMAPLPGGMNGAQHAVVGLANLGGDFAGAVWTPFSEQALGRGDPIAPRPKAAAWRSAIARVLLAETCAHVANANATRIGDDPYIEVNDEHADGALLVRYDGDGRGMPRDLCGALRFDGLDGEGSRGIAAHGHRRAMEGLLPALRGLAVELGERYLPGSPVHGQPLSDVEAAMNARGLAESYEAVLDEALGRAASEERLALERAVAEDAAGSSWLAAAGFFNTIASRTGLFQAAAHNVPDAALPLPSLEEWSPPAAAAVKGLLASLASSRTWQPVFFAAGGGVTGTLPAAGGGDGGLVAGLFEFIDLDSVVIADSGNPIADLAGFGHDLIASALGAIGAISGVAVGSGLLESIPFFGKGLDAFESVWRVTDGFVSTILGLMLIAGAVLAFVLPALPFIRFLFGVFGWLVNVVEAVLAVTVFAAAHVTRGRGEGLMVPATRQGWLFLPGLILRPPLMLFGLILGYFVFLAAIGLLNAIWLPQLRDAGASDGLGPVGFLAMLTLYVMICYALMNGAFKLIELLPSAVLEWIGGRAGGTDDGAGRLAGAVTGGIARAGSGRLTGRLRGGSGSGG